MSQTNALRQLIYRSVAAWALNPAELQHLLDVARGRNEREALTGLLVYQRGRFVQWLEGPQDALQAVWASIQRDPRHTEVERLHSPRLSQRLFPDWRMMFSSDAPDLARRQLELPPDSLRELRNIDANTGAVVQGLALWYQLPSPEDMADSLTSSDDGPAAALAGLVLALRPSWQAVGWHLLGPVARALGDAWQRDAITAVELGIALARLQRLLRELGARRGAQHAERSDRSVLVAPQPGESELTGVVFAGVAMDSAGWEVCAAFPRSWAELERSVAQTHHDVLHIAMSDALRRDNRLAEMAGAIRALHRASVNRQLQILVSGRAFAEQPGLAETLGADGDGLAQGSDGRDLEAMMNWARQRSAEPAAMVAQAALSSLSLKLQENRFGPLAAAAERAGRGRHAWRSEGKTGEH
jgi:hypothetical protein